MYGLVFKTVPFLRHKPIFKIAIFVHETGKLKKVPEAAYGPGGRNWAYFYFTVSDFRDTSRFSKLPYLGLKHGI